MIRQKFRRKRIEGVDVALLDTEVASDLTVDIVYPIPIALETKFAGIPHLFEHMIFMDILDGYRTTSDLFNLASKHNIQIDAFTSKHSITFNLTMKSFILPKDSPGYHSVKRFDITKDSYKLLKELLYGIMKPHAFTDEQLNKEREIVLSEIEHDSGVIESIVNNLTIATSGSDILGGRANIEHTTTRIINEFASKLPLPKIAIRTDSRKDYFCEIEDDIEDILESVFNRSESRGSLKSIDVGKLRTIDRNIYDGITDVRYISTDLNGLAVVLPVTKSTSKEEIEREFIQGVAVEMIFDAFYKGSIAHLLREELGIIYGFTYIGKIKGEYNASIDAYITNIEDKVNFKNNRDLSALLERLDQCICNMVCPSETEYASTLSMGLVPSFRDITYKGFTRAYLRHLSLVQVPKSIVDSMIEMPFDFSYEFFTEIFDEVKNSLSIVVL